MNTGLLVEESEAPASPGAFKSEKIAIVRKTLSFQANIMLYQLITICVLRFILLRHQPTDYSVESQTRKIEETYGIYAMTLGERTSGNYFATQWAKAAPKFCEYTGHFCPEAEEKEEAGAKHLGEEGGGNCITIDQFWSSCSNAAPWVFPEYCPDAVSNVMGDPKALMPWWMVPVFQSLISVLQYICIQFDLPFKKKEQHGWFEFVQKFVLTGGFIILAIKSWSHDISMLGKTVGNDWIEGIVLKMGVMVLSGNLLKALALWGGFKIQSPVAAIRCKPQYTCMPGCTSLGFPLSPCGAVWLHPMKWLYAMLLAPYVLVIPIVQLVPQLIMYAGSFVVGCMQIGKCLKYVFCCGLCKSCWKCLQSVFKCGPCIALWKCLQWTFACGPCILAWSCCLKPCIYCAVSTVGAVCTLFLWTFARDSFLYWLWALFGLAHLWPIFGLFILQIWAICVPKLVAKLYSMLIGASSSEHLKAVMEDSGGSLMAVLQGGMQGVQGMARSNPFMMPTPLMIDAQTRKCLFELDVESAEKDFLPPDPSDPEAEAGIPQQ